MIKYSLICEIGHEFEGWFQNSGAFDNQSAHSLISCPSCGTFEVQKALMAPAVATRSKQSEPVQNHPTPGPEATTHAYVPPSIQDIVRKIRGEIEKQAEYVGPEFAEEARRIHYTESPERQKAFRFSLFPCCQKSAIKSLDQDDCSVSIKTKSSPVRLSGRDGNSVVISTMPGCIRSAIALRTASSALIRVRTASSG
jgi:hypothetical protein